MRKWKSPSNSNVKISVRVILNSLKLQTNLLWRLNYFYSFKKFLLSYFYHIRLICKLKCHYFIRSFLPIRFGRAVSTKAVLSRPSVIFCSMNSSISHVKSLGSWNHYELLLFTSMSLVSFQHKDQAGAEMRSWTAVLKVGMKGGDKGTGRKKRVQHSTSKNKFILHFTYTNTHSALGFNSTI